MISISLSSRLSSSQLPKHQRTLPGSFQILPSCGVPHHTTAISPVAQVLHGVLKILLLACADQWVPKFQFTLSLFLERINQRENHGNTLKQMECFMFTSNWLTDRHCFFSIFPVSSDQSSEIECHKIQQNKVCLQLSMVKHKHVGTSCSACHGSSPASFRATLQLLKLENEQNWDHTMVRNRTGNVTGESAAKPSCIHFWQGS